MLGPSHRREQPLPHLGHAVVANAGLPSLLPNGPVDLPHGLLVEAETLREPERAAHLGGGSVGLLVPRPYQLLLKC